MQRTGQIVIIRQNMQHPANLTRRVLIYGGCRNVCLILLTSACCVSHSAERGSHFTVCVFLSLHDYSLLKVIKYSKLHKRGEKGREREMRGKAHLHLYLKWQMQMDQMIWREGKCEFLSAAICRWKMKRSVFSIGRGLLHLYQMPSYQTCNKPAWFHRDIPNDILKQFSAAISLFCLRFYLSYAATAAVSAAGLKTVGFEMQSLKTHSTAKLRARRVTTSSAVC